MKAKKDIFVQFNDLHSKFDRLGKNLVEALKSFLDLEKIPYVNIYHRVKDFDSFFEKIDRKKYKNPFDEIEDVCGIRIICYYASDIEKIEKIISNELNVLESQDKSNTLGLKEFAYRSIHNIIKINDSWTATPNYRDLKNLKAEIQIRTILMHAWAEVEHKLNYKSDEQVPANFQRKLFRLSAKFEEADEQFEELRNGIILYRENLEENAKRENKFDTTQDLNRDSYLAFLHYHFPDAPKIENFYLNKTFDDLKKEKVTIEDLEDIIKKIKPHIMEISNDLSKNGYANNVHEMPTEIIGFARQAFGLKDNKGTLNEWKTIVEKWKKKLK